MRNNNLELLCVSGSYDMDNPPDASLIRFAAGSVNLPAGLGGNSAMCIQQFASGTTAYNAQLAFNFNSDKIAIRRRAGSLKWTDWKYFTAS